MMADEEIVDMWLNAVEDLYGILEENVSYIHGYRRKRKGCPKEALILGHRPGDSDVSFDGFQDH